MLNKAFYCYNNLVVEIRSVIMYFVDQFNSLNAVEAERLARDDLNNEIAGLNTSRRVRFGVGNAGDGIDGEGRSKKERIARTLEWLLINDPEYKRLHEEAMTAVYLASERARDMITLIESELAAIHGILADIMDSAAQLQDGLKVFKDENGVVRFADGEVVADEDAATIQWTGNEPGYEYMRRAQDRETVLNDALHGVRGIEVEIGGYQNELTNNETPAEQARMHEVMDRAEAVQDQLLNLESKIGANLQSDAASDYDSNVGLASTSGVESTSLPDLGLGGIRQ